MSVPSDCKTSEFANLHSTISRASASGGEPKQGWQPQSALCSYKAIAEKLREKINTYDPAL